MMRDNKLSRGMMALLIALMMLVLPAVTHAQADPVVHAVLFYSPSCPHCHDVINNDLPPLMERYGEQLLILGVDVSQAEGAALYNAMRQALGVPDTRVGVPTMVVGDTVLVGSGEIPQLFPGIVEQGVSGDGIPWPAIPGLADLLPEEEAAVSEATEASMDASSLTVSERIARDPVGNALAIGMLGLMTASVFGVGAYLLRSRGKTLKGASYRLDGWRSWAVLALCIVGVFVAGYLAYVETTNTAAVCGPVGDCNTVQQSDFALLFGFLPVGVLGMMGYIAILGAWAVHRFGGNKIKPAAAGAMFLFVAFGTLFSMYLTFLEPFVIGATCAWCLTSALIMTSLLIILTPPTAQAVSVLRKQTA